MMVCCSIHASPNTTDHHAVVTLLLVNSDDASAEDLAGEFEASGIDSYGYTPSSTSGPIDTWPTLQTLIDANTRLMTFVASLSSDDNSVAPYLMDEFTYIFENNFDVTALSNFTCTPARPSAVAGDTSTAISSGYLPLMNHFLDEAEGFGIEIPDIDNITITNSPSTNITGALGTSAQTCKNEYQKQPTFILVDFFEEGPALSTVDSLNGVTNAVGRTTVSAPSTSTSGAQKGVDLAQNALFAMVGVVAYMIVFM